VFDDPNLSPPPRKGISTYTIVSLIVFGLALAYVVGVFYMRWHSNRVIEERAAEKQRSHDERVVQAQGRRPLRDSQFLCESRGDSARRFDHAVLQRFERQIGDAPAAIECRLAGV